MRFAGKLQKSNKYFFSFLVFLSSVIVASSVSAEKPAEPSKTKVSANKKSKPELKRFENQYGRMTIYQASHKRGTVVLVDYLSPSGLSAELAYSPNDAYWEFSALGQVMTAHQSAKSRPIHVSLSSPKNSRQWSFDFKNGLESFRNSNREISYHNYDLSPQFFSLYADFLNFLEQESRTNDDFSSIARSPGPLVPVQSKSCGSTLAWTGISITATAMLAASTCLGSSGIACGAAVAAWTAGSALANDNAMAECGIEEEGDGGGGGGW